MADFSLSPYLESHVMELFLQMKKKKNWKIITLQYSSGFYFKINHISKIDFCEFDFVEVGDGCPISGSGSVETPVILRTQF